MLCLTKRYQKESPPCKPPKTLLNSIDEFNAPLNIMRNLRTRTRIYEDLHAPKNKPKKLHFHSTPRIVVVWVDDLQLPRAEAFFGPKSCAMSMARIPHKPWPTAKNSARNFSSHDHSGFFFDSCAKRRPHKKHAAATLRSIRHINQQQFLKRQLSVDVKWLSQHHCGPSKPRDTDQS